MSKTEPKYSTGQKVESVRGSIKGVIIDIQTVYAVESNEIMLYFQEDEIRPQVDKK